MRKIGLGEIGVLKGGVGQIRVGNARIACGGIGEIGAREIGVLHAFMRQIGAAKIAATAIGLTRLDAFERGFLYGSGKRDRGLLHGLHRTRTRKERDGAGRDGGDNRDSDDNVLPQALYRS